MCKVLSAVHALTGCVRNRGETSLKGQSWRLDLDHLSSGDIAMLMSAGHLLQDSMTRNGKLNLTTVIKINSV